MLAIVPARSGSKGLPGKNTKLLGGKPLIAYTIEAALRSRHITDVVVSTDGEVIAETAKKLGARVPFMRPPQLATDESLAIDAYLYTIDRLVVIEKKQIDTCVVLLPTSPLRTHEDIDQAIDLFSEKKADSVISYTEESHPISWHKRIRSDLRFENIWKNDSLNNRQSYEKTYYPNGAIYVFRTEVLRHKQYYTGNSFGYIMPKERSIDIDTDTDFKLAEFYLTHRDA